MSYLKAAQAAGPLFLRASLPGSSRLRLSARASARLSLTRSLSPGPGHGDSEPLEVVVYYCRTWMKAVRGGVKRGDVCYGMLRAAACVNESDHHALMYVWYGRTVRGDRVGGGATMLQPLMLRFFAAARPLSEVLSAVTTRSGNLEIPCTSRCSLATRRKRLEFTFAV